MSGVFTVPEPAGRLKKNRFQFRLGDAVESLPKMEFAPPEVDEFLDSVQGKRVMQADYIIGLMVAYDPEVGEKVKAARLHRDQLRALHKAWDSASKVDVEKSSGSDDSSTSTRSPSEPTSSDTAEASTS
jgi:hypothetical protein